MNTPTEDEISQFLQMNNLSRSSDFNERELKDFFVKCGMPQMQNEITQHGFASDFYNDVNMTLV